MKAGMNPSLKDKSAYQQIGEIIEDPFVSHETVKERIYEITAHFWWHQQREHSQRPG